MSTSAFLMVFLVGSAAVLLLLGLAKLRGVTRRLRRLQAEEQRPLLRLIGPHRLLIILFLACHAAIITVVVAHTHLLGELTVGAILILGSAFLLFAALLQARLIEIAGRRTMQTVRLREEIENHKRTETELQRLQAEVNRQNINLVRKSIDLSDTMRELEDRNYDLEQMQADLETTLASLRESEEKYRKIFESFQDVYFHSDLHSRILVISPSVRARLGYAAGEVIGRSVTDYLADPQEKSELFKKISNDKEVNDYELKLMSKEGSVISFSLNAHLLRDGDGNPTGVEGVLRDINQRKETETELARHREHLEELVQERTAELAEANRELQTEIEERRKAEQAAETANRLKSHFLAGVSHEIRTPLSAIIGFAEIILGSTSLKVIHEQVRIILRESNQLLFLVNDLLDHAKIEAGKLELEHQPFDLRQLLGQIDSTVISHAKEKELRFLTSVARDVPRFIIGDPVRLRQILLNLISNAVKFTDSGSVQVQVTRTGIENQRVALQFSVIDTGIGIPEEKQEAVFHSFTQLSGADAQRYGGTGLGTAIARRLVELMDGEIGLSSEPGEGSTFWFTVAFEVCDAAPDSDEFDQEAFEPLVPTALPRSAGRILLAEDYFANQKVMRLQLESAGYSLDIVDNGRGVIEACRNNTYDLILMDVQMPEMDGLEATRLIRSSESEWSRTPIIGITAHAAAADRAACLDAGMNDVLTKPVRHRPLLSTVSRWLAAGSNGAGARPGPCTRNGEAAAVCPIDYEAAVEGFGGDRSLVDTVLRHFLDQVEAQLPLLQAALSEADTETLRREVNKIRSGAANLTAAPLAASAERLERITAAGRLEEAGAQMTRLREELTRLRETMPPPSPTPPPRTSRTCH